MCSETFLRLPEEKRQRFLSAAWEELTRVPYQDTSINQIVHRAGVARGSFYQYFKDKDDLLHYLLQSGWDYLAERYGELLQETEGDLFAQQLLCYDTFVAQCAAAADPTLGHFLSFLRLNPGFDFSSAVCGRPASAIFQRCCPHLRPGLLRQEGEDFAFEVFTLCFMILVHAVVETILRPEGAAQFRQELEARLEIIRWGSVTPAQEGATL